MKMVPRKILDLVFYIYVVSFTLKYAQKLKWQINTYQRLAPHTVLIRSFSTAHVRCLGFGLNFLGSQTKIFPQKIPQAKTHRI